MVEANQNSGQLGLQGIRVIEMAHVISGPFAGMILADLGAEVIKVEEPNKGDAFRGWDVQESGPRPSFASLNRGKKSISIDVRKPEGQEVYRTLVSTADVILENFRPNTLRKYKLDCANLRLEWPSLIYCSVSGYGSSSTDADRPAYDAVIQGLSGLWSQLTDVNNLQPIGPAFADQISGMFAAIAIMSALVRRSISGMGQEIDISMLSAMLSFQPLAAAAYLLTGDISDATARGRRSRSFAFQASDGKVLTIHLSSSAKFWSNLLVALGREELATDVRFDTPPKRTINYDELRSELATTFSQRPRDQWLQILSSSDVPAGPWHNIGEALDDPFVRSMGAVHTYGIGDRALDLVGLTFGTIDSLVDQRLGVPNCGEHNEEILGALGYEVAEILQMKEKGII